PVPLPLVPASPPVESPPVPVPLPPPPVAGDPPVVEGPSDVSSDEQPPKIADSSTSTSQARTKQAMAVEISPADFVLKRLCPGATGTGERVRCRCRCRGRGARTTAF